MHTLKLFAALIAPAVLATAPKLADDLAFKPAADSRVDKTFVHKLDLTLDEMHFKFGEEEVPSGDLGQFDLSIVDESKIEFSDHYVSLAAGRPKVLERKFVALASGGVEKVKTEDGGDERKTDRTSHLEGKTVIFKYGDEGGDPEIAFDEKSAGDKALLDGLVEDADLRAFLPGRAVADGDTWAIDAKHFNALFSPGGEMHLESSEPEEDSQVNRVELRDNVQGKIKATYKGERDEKGVKVAVIALEFEVNTHADDDDELDEGVTQHSEYAIDLKLEGELLWDNAAGHAHSVDIHGKAKVKIEQLTHSKDDEDGGDFSQTMLLSGDATVTATFEGAK